MNKSQDSEPLEPNNSSESTAADELRTESTPEQDAEHVPTDSSSSMTEGSGESIVEADVVVETPSNSGVVLAETSEVDQVVVAPNDGAHSGLGPIWEVAKLALIPFAIVAAFAVGIAMIGVAQRSGWIESASAGSSSSEIGMTSEESDVSYICPMMCVPPTSKPGRCPVCAMELVPASKGSSSGPSSNIQIDPRSRRIAGIQTVKATSQTLFREVRGVGEISYNESNLKTLTAYIDGRIEELYADYTGIEVKKGDSLALLYSPDLYVAQVSYARTLEFAENATGGSPRTVESNRRLLDSSRQRLVELGMTEGQVKQLEIDKKPSSRIALHAPMSGTVIEKMAVTGQDIKAGTPLYKLADLSSVWLVMELFPEDASVIQLGQAVTAYARSMNGEPSEGVVEFVEPTVDPKMRTVGVRVAINNKHGQLKPGEFVRATLKIPILSKGGEAQQTVVVPRNSLLSIGQTSLVYVEGKPGEFELRRVKTGPTVEGQVAIFEGIVAGENVVAKSTFLLDAQMQLQGNPSLIDPDKAVVDGETQTQLTEAELEEIRKAMEPLSEEDRKLAEAQVICPVTEVRLGTLGMGTPIKLELEGRTVFICCEGCRDGWVEDPAKYFKILDDYLAGKSSVSTAPAPANNEPIIPQLDLPQMELPQMELPKMDLPKMEPPK